MVVDIADLGNRHTIAMLKMGFNRLTHGLIGPWSDRTLAGPLGCCLRVLGYVLGPRLSPSTISYFRVVLCALPLI